MARSRGVEIMGELGGRARSPCWINVVWSEEGAEDPSAMGVKAAHVSAGDGEEAVLEVAPSSGDEEDEKIKKEV